MLLYLLNLTVPHEHQNWSCTCLRFPSAVFLLNARESKNGIFFTISDEHQQSPWSNFGHRSTPRRFLCCGVLLAVWHFLLPIQQFICPCVSWRNFIQTSGHKLSGLVVCWTFIGLPFTYLHSSRSLERTIWNLVVPVHPSERLTPFASVHKSLILCSETLSTLICVCLVTSTYFNGIGNVSLSGSWSFKTGCFMMSIIKFSTHRPRILCFLTFFVAFFDSNIIFWLEVSSAINDGLVLSFFWRECLRLLLLANLHHLLPSSLLTNLSPHVAYCLRIFISAFPVQTDLLLTCLFVVNGKWSTNVSKRNWWSVQCLTTSFLEHCLAIGHFIMHVAQVTTAFRRTIPSLLR